MASMRFADETSDDNGLDIARFPFISRAPSTASLTPVLTFRRSGGDDMTFQESFVVPCNPTQRDLLTLKHEVHRLIAIAAIMIHWYNSDVKKLSLAFSMAAFHYLSWKKLIRAAIMRQRCRQHVFACYVVAISHLKASAKVYVGDGHRSLMQRFHPSRMRHAVIRQKAMSAAPLTRHHITLINRDINKTDGY